MIKKLTSLLFVFLFLFSLLGVFSNSTLGNTTSFIKTTINSNLDIQFNDFSEEHFGDQFLFWLNIPELVQMRGTLLAVGNWSYIYMANDTVELLGQNASVDKCNQIRDVFDEAIYPKALEIAGSPDGNLGDIDGDPHVTIFLAPLVRNYGDNSVLGYYDNKDDDPANPYSNLREMFYVDSEKSVSDTINIIIHEFNHMIWYNYELDEAQFLTEGLANYAIDYSGYYSWVTDAVTDSFTQHPEISLLYFNREYGSLWDASYGQAYLFVTYLVERFGNEFTKKLVSMSEDGALAVELALTSEGYDLTFNDLYLDWITACVIDDTGCYDGIYGFDTVDYRILKKTGIGYYLPIEKNNIVHYYYGFEVKEINAPNDNFTFIIDNPHPYALGISIAIKDNNGWNVTQIINTKRSDKIALYCEGEDIQESYVITSLMTEQTPPDYGQVYSLEDVESVNLSYEFLEGYIEIDEGSFSTLIVFSTILFVSGTLVILRRRRKN